MFYDQSTRIYHTSTVPANDYDVKVTHSKYFEEFRQAKFSVHFFDYIAVVEHLFCESD